MSVIKTDLITLAIGAVCMVGVVSWVVWAVCTRGTRGDGACHLSFKQFKSFYTMNPARWRLYDDEARYQDGSLNGIGCTFPNIFHVTQYAAFRRKVMRRENDLRDIQRSKQLITAIQNDIIDTKKRAQKNILMSQAEYLEIISRIHVIE